MEISLEQCDNYSGSFRVLYKGYNTGSKGGPAKLLVVTDLLSKLGYIFVQPSEEGDDFDILNASAHNLDEGENKLMLLCMR